MADIKKEENEEKENEVPLGAKNILRTFNNDLAVSVKKLSEIIRMLAKIKHRDNEEKVKEEMKEGKKIFVILKPLITEENQGPGSAPKKQRMEYVEYDVAGYDAKVKMTNAILDESRKLQDEILQMIQYPILAFFAKEVFVEVQKNKLFKNLRRGLAISESEAKAFQLQADQLEELWKECQKHLKPLSERLDKMEQLDETTQRYVKELSDKSLWRRKGTGSHPPGTVKMEFVAPTTAPTPSAHLDEPVISNVHASSND